MSFRELYKNAECAHCGESFRKGSVTGRKYCSPPCRREGGLAKKRANFAANYQRRKRKKQVQREARARDRRGPDGHQIPAEVLALGQVKIREKTVPELVVVIRELSGGSEWFAEWIDQVFRLHNKTQIRKELRQAVELLGGSTEHETR